MRKTAVRGALVALLLAAASGELSSQAQQRSLYVSVLDRSGVPVADVARSDLTVREDKVEREILSVARAGEPLHVALLVDNSQAADPYIREYRDALAGFVTAIAGDQAVSGNQVSIITLADRPTVAIDYTSNVEGLTKEARRVFAFRGSGSYLLDAILETLTGFRKREVSRPAIVAVITAGPDLSYRHYEEVVEALRGSGATFHVIVVGRPIGVEVDRSVVLSAGTHDTGGRYENVLAASALSARLKQVADDLTHQYKVTYARPQTLIPPERITVAAAKEGLTVRGIPVKGEHEQGRP
ncbi:MAG: hypothetical protein DMF89_01790 [Acidobacteria bacterium]|nr:MAG: hypothetical protein DMF90_25770 [Acidobacteriota bacterium]PYR52671.1 MAG: hypothetical protein DMF89_01790 [Acidobacteriota bacterium]